MCIKFASMILSGIEDSLELPAKEGDGQRIEWQITQLGRLIGTIADLCRKEIERQYWNPQK